MSTPLRILEFLMANPGRTAPTIARALERDERTINRALTALADNEWVVAKGFEAHSRSGAKGRLWWATVQRIK